MKLTEAKRVLVLKESSQYYLAISYCGRIFNTITGNELKPYLDCSKAKQLRVNAIKIENKKMSKVNIARIYYQLFVGEVPAKYNVVRKYSKTILNPENLECLSKSVSAKKYGQKRFSDLEIVQLDDKQNVINSWDNAVLCAKELFISPVTVLDYINRRTKNPLYILERRIL